MKPAKSPEVRVLQSLRQTNVISKAEMDACIALLEATEPCDRCGATGVYPPPPQAGGPGGGTCEKCEGTGQMYSIR